MDNKKKKNKNKGKQEQQTQQQQQQTQNQIVPAGQQHHHDHHGNEDHHHDHNNCNHGLPSDLPNLDPTSLLNGLSKGEGLLGSLSMIPKLTEMLNQLSNFGGQAFKPDDPLPDFTKFDSTKQTLEVAIEEFQKTIENVQKKDFNLTKPVVQKQQQQKLSKQQQQQREKNNQIIKQNIDYLNTLQKDMKKLLQDQSLSGIAPILNQGIENLNQDIQYYQKQQEV
ncbi:unnamed protein product [Paramecium sonneborni]|uniref:Uncharacterized protein n=1 Tax=Paramecium sonneborni TaxID=65129 RepID=A0A8S1RE22_9CILI|nr:unnamed protein product [Paramecium sonneborni]